MAESRLILGEEGLPEVHRQRLLRSQLDPAVLAAVQARPEMLHDLRTEELYGQLLTQIKTVLEHTGFQNVEQHPREIHPDWKRVAPGDPPFKNAIDMSIKKNPHVPAADTQLKQLDTLLLQPLSPAMRASITARRAEVQARRNKIEQEKREEMEQRWKTFCYFRDCPDGLDPATAGRPNPTPTVDEMNVGNLDIFLAYTMATQTRAPAYDALSQIQHISSMIAEQIPGFPVVRDFRGATFDQVLGVAGQLRALHHWAIDNYPRDTERETASTVRLPLAADSLDATERARMGDLLRRHADRDPGLSNQSRHLLRLARDPAQAHLLTADKRTNIADALAAIRASQGPKRQASIDAAMASLRATPPTPIDSAHHKRLLRAIVASIP